MDETLWFRIGYLVERGRQAAVALAPSEKEEGEGVVAGDPTGAAETGSRFRLPSLAELRERLGGNGKAAAGGAGSQEGDGASSTEGRGGTGGSEGSGGAGGGAGLGLGLHPALETLVATGASALGAELLGRWIGRGTPSVRRMGRAAAAGGVAGFVAHLATLLGERWVCGDASADEAEVETDAAGRELALAVLVGAGRGLLYAGLVDPRLPGPPAVRGLAFGAGEHLLGSARALEELLGPAGMHQSVPFLDLVLDLGEEEPSLFEDLTFGVLVGILYGD